ncbi:MAG TPA: PBP1A family penicillin-binding protein [Patescibacteria group bacterium]|nr:PBP1A family penicillin-binding protein [Patescibacteria group bacterium]
MPIPQLEKKGTKKTDHPHDVSLVRKKRAANRQHPTEKKASASSSEKKTTEKGKKKEQKKWWKKMLIILFILCILGIGSGAIAVGAAYIWVSKDLADISDINKRAVRETTKIYANDDQTLLYEVGDNQRIEASLDKIDKKIQQATVALEDRRFYEHKGIDLIGLARAAMTWTNMSTAQGASTLTQQFVGNAVLSKERTIKRKIKEGILSYRLERKFSKDKILEMYLNEVYYGANYQGVEVAAQEYFGKSANEVTLVEAATLASLPKRPTVYPRDHERLKIRRDYALDIMAELGNITKEEAEAAKQEPITLQEKTDREKKAPHFTDYVIEQLSEKYGQKLLRDGGMRVVTSLDWDKQQKAEKVISDSIGTIEEWGGDNAALVALDAHHGHILAMVGSRDYFDPAHDGEFNVATSPTNQPGSSFKPIVYSLAFSKGYTPDTRVYDLETDFPIEGAPVYHPHNFDMGTRGPITLRYALSQSLNIPAVKMAYLGGVNNIMDTVEKLGYAPFVNKDSLNLSVALGAGDVSVLDHTSAFATFAREGERHKPIAIIKITNQSGNTIEAWKDEPQQVLDQQAVRMLNSVLSDSGARGYTFRGLNLSDRPAAAKTGTSNDFRDAWTMGYTPSIAVGVWTGRTDNQPMKNMADGIFVAAPIWRAYMESILAGTPVETFQDISYKAANAALGGNLDIMKEYTIDKSTGAIIPDECISTYPKEYTEKKEFKETHTILYYINKDNPTGSASAKPQDDPMFNSWESAVQSWAKTGGREKEYLTDATPKASCNLTNSNQQPSVSISSLQSGNVYTPKTFKIVGSAQPGKERSITTVVYKIDETVVSTQSTHITSTNFVASSYNATNLTNGRHTVTIQVIDDRGNRAESSVKILFKERLVPDSSPTPVSNSNQNNNTNSNNTNKKTNSNE